MRQLTLARPGFLIVPDARRGHPVSDNEGVRIKNAIRRDAVKGV